MKNADLDYNIVSFLIRGRRRIKVLSSLKKAQMPKQIAIACGLSLSNVSIALSELAKKGLIKCLNPGEKTYKFYIMTEEGKKSMESLRNLERNKQIPAIQ